MSKFEDGSYGSITGIALLGKVLAGRCDIKYTRVAVGNGIIPEGETPSTMLGPAGYVMDARITKVTNPVDGECQVTVQISSEDAENGFYATSIVLYAEDPDEGEVPYTYLSLENEPEWIRPANSSVGKFSIIDIIAVVGDVNAVTAKIDSEAFALAADLAAYREENDKAVDGKLDKVGDGSDVTVAFGQAGTRANISTGEKLSVIFGKIAKFFADLKTVAFSGSYNDLKDTPEIPTVNNGILTIQKNGTKVQTFSANQSFNATANIAVPTKVSELTNDSGYKTTDTNTWRGIQNNLTSDSTSDSLSAAQGKALKSLIDGKAASSHTHDDRYYTESEIDTKLNGKAASSHTHDDRYYTESEIDTKLNGKANSSHTHTISQIAYLDDNAYLNRDIFNGNIDTITKSGIYWLPNNSSDGHYTGTTPSGSYPYAFIMVHSMVSGAIYQQYLPFNGTGAIGTMYERFKANGKWSAWRVILSSDSKPADIGAAPASHTHDGRYYTESEIDTKLDGKAPKASPEFTGSVSLGRKAGSTKGAGSATTGTNNVASNNYTASIGGSGNYASGHQSATLGGNGNSASGQNAVCLGGNNCAANNINGACVGGDTNIAADAGVALGGNGVSALTHQIGIGHYNNITTAKAGYYSGTTDGTAFVVGNGTASSRSNAFRVNYNGAPYAKSALVTTGCDYAEYFEWIDGNLDGEDRRGYFVALDGKKIRKAEPGDWILGIVSGFPSIIGNGDEEWLGRYVFDEFGTPVTEEVEEARTVINENGEEETITETVKRWKENPDYDETRGYTERADRPEWDAVGMLGVLSVRDDGTCKVNGFCRLADGGTATAAESTDGGVYRVIKRVTDDIIEIIFK